MVQSRARAVARTYVAGLAVMVMVLTGAVGASAAEESPTAPVETTDADISGPHLEDEAAVQEGAEVADTSGEEEVRALAAGGAITGQVTSDGDPVVALPGVAVSARQVGGLGYGETLTDDSGGYTLEGLPPGDYLVLFEPDGDYAFEFWGDTTDEESARAVTVAEAVTHYGVDAQLAAAAHIEGLVLRDLDGSPVADASATAYNADGAMVASAQTDEAGRYIINGLPAGSYVLYFEGDETLMPQFWEGAIDRDDASPLVLATGEITDADARLLPNQSISGTVTRSSDGTPVQGEVWVSDESGAGVSGAINTDGSYSVFVAPGTYTLRFISYEDTALGEYWPDARREADAVPITVGEGEHLVGIDAVLESTALITGTIDTGDAAVYDRFVEAYDEDGVFVAMAYANRSGTYTLYVPAGTYIVRAGAVAQEGQADLGFQYFDQVATAEDATPITVAETDTRDGIDFTLGDTAAPAAPVEPPTERPIEDDAVGTGALASTGMDVPVPMLMFAAMMLATGTLLLSGARRMPKRSSDERSLSLGR